MSECRLLSSPPVHPPVHLPIHPPHLMPAQLHPRSRCENHQKDMGSTNGARGRGAEEKRREEDTRGESSTRKGQSKSVGLFARQQAALGLPNCQGLPSVSREDAGPHMECRLELDERQNKRSFSKGHRTLHRPGRPVLSSRVSALTVDPEPGCNYVSSGVPRQLFRLASGTGCHRRDAGCAR